MEEFECVREKKMIDYIIDHVEASVVLEWRSNVEALAAAEFP